MNLVPPGLGLISAAKVRGVVLCALSVGAGYAYYSASGPDDSVAVAASGPPLVRAEPMGMPVRVIHEASAVDTIPASPPDSATLTRDLQRALAKANCYKGPISGKWTPASKQAMGSFLVAVNAQLPVDGPDPTLLALVASNTAATCAPAPSITTGAIGPPSSPQHDNHHATMRDPSIAVAPPPAPADEPKSPVDDRPMIDRAWAPPEMLVPPKEPPPTPPQTASAAAAPMTVSTAEPISEHREPASVPSPSSPIPAPAVVAPVAAAPPPVVHFEGYKFEAEPDPKAGQIEAARSAAAAQSPDPVADVAASPPAKVARKKGKSRRKSDYDDVSTSISKGFDSIQRQISSFFD